MTFTVEYCRNWDGGRQELGAASEAVHNIFPDAQIKAVVSDDYPITVSVLFGGKVLWTGSQRNLFSKYYKARTKSMREIQKACIALKKEL